MTLRLRIILGLLIGVTTLVVVFGAYKLITFMSRNLKNAGNTQGTMQPLPPQEKKSFFDTQQQPVQQAPQQQVPEKKLSQDDTRAKADLVAFALPFAERFGSYSNQSNFENLSDLLPFMTNSMKKWAQEKIDTAKKSGPNTLYKGVTTKALSHSILLLDSSKGEAQIRVSTQRKELIGTSTNFKVYNQELELKFVKEDGTWLVDSAQWQ